MLVLLLQDENKVLEGVVDLAQQKEHTLQIDDGVENAVWHHVQFVLAETWHQKVMGKNTTFYHGPAVSRAIVMWPSIKEVTD